MKSKISAALLIGLMVLSSFAAFAAPAGAATYTIAQVLAWSVTGGDSSPSYTWGQAPASVGRPGQVTGQIRDTDNQPWMFPSNVTIVNASNSTIDPALLRMYIATIFWPFASAGQFGTAPYQTGSTGTSSFVEFPEYEHYTFVGVNSSFNSSGGNPLDPLTDSWYKTLVHYKVGPRWYTGQTNSYSVDADSSTTADVVIRPPPYYLCKTENDYSVSAGQNVTITFTLYDVRSYLWQAQTGGNPCNDAKNRSAGYTIAVYATATNNTGNNPAYNPAINGGGFYSAGNFWDNATTVATDSTGKATIVWTAPNCSFWGWVNITAIVTADPLINVTWNNKITGSGANRVYVEPCEAQWTCKVMDGMGNGVCTNTSWVTLYIMNSTGAWIIPKTVTPGNPTQPTSSPYCGSFAFGHIPVNDSGTYAYVYANMTLGSMVIEGYSGNDVGTVPVSGAKGEPIWAHILHTGRTATGCVVLDIPCADKVVITANPTTILAGGYNSTVTAQLYKNGSAYFLSGVDIEFKLNNTAYATLVGGSAAGVKTVKSDAQGKASVVIQSKDVSGVYVRVWANVTCNSLSNDTLIFISGWATLSGYVTDTNQVGIPGATVTLWPLAVFNATSAKWEHAATTASIDTYVKNNPQLSNSGATSPLGTYTFDHIPWGVYYVEANVTNLTATKTLTLWFAICWINTSSAYTNNIAVPNFVAPTPTTVATTTAVTTATTVATTTAVNTTAVATTTTVPPTTTTTSPGFGALMALIGLGGVAYLVIRRRS